MSDHVCSECGAPVGRYFTFPSYTVAAWQHADGTEGTACADARGDRDWHAVPPEVYALEVDDESGTVSPAVVGVALMIVAAAYVAGHVAVWLMTAAHGIGGAS
jgi:hypothetical protein